MIYYNYEVGVFQTKHFFTKLRFQNDLAEVNEKWLKNRMLLDKTAREYFSKYTHHILTLKCTQKKKL